MPDCRNRAVKVSRKLLPNTLLREYFPKGESLGHVSERHVQEVYDKLNRRPRKRLGYRTPYEVHCSKTLHLI